jgi:thymidylate kinase
MPQVTAPAADAPPTAPTLTPSVAPDRAELAEAKPIDVAEQALRRFFQTLQQNRIPFWIIDGYGDGAFDPVDIDVLVPRAALPDTIAKAIHESRQSIGASLLSWDRDNQLVLACDRGNASIAAAAAAGSDTPKFLRVHLRPDYRRVGRFFYEGDEVLAAQPPRAGRDAEAFATPMSPREFGCYLIEKIAKVCFAPVHERVLAEAFRNDPDGCANELRRFWSAANASLLEAAARSGNWEIVRRAQADLRGELRRAAFFRRPFWTIGYRLAKGVRRVVEFLRPSTGLHVVMLGPDGVGKTTVVEELQHDLASAFCGIEYGTFAPGLLPTKPNPTGGGQPHGKPPRSLPASIIKAIWWIVYYSVGYHVTIRPVLARGGLALNHRYCVDAMVDSRRYRYKGPQWLLRLAWRVARKPDLVFLLDAPPEVVQARKKEVAFEETVRQRDAYRDLVRAMPNGHIIDATQPVANVVADVERAIFRFMADRTARQLGLAMPVAAPAGTAVVASTLPPSAHADTDAAISSAGSAVRIAS